MLTSAAGNANRVKVGRQHSQAQRGRAPRDRIGRKPPRTSRILIVEDEIFVAWHLESVLRDLRFSVCGLVPDGEAAVTQAGELEAELILMDINLKGAIDGVEAARRIRQDRELPIIFITAYTDAMTLARVEATIPGATVLSKPVSPDRLNAAIAKALAAPAG
jgi:CheY-like chemotaxis protein